MNTNILNIIHAFFIITRRKNAIIYNILANYIGNKIVCLEIGVAAALISTIVHEMDTGFLSSF